MDYSRQLKLDFIGEEEQERLKDSKVVVFGAGGLGCIVLPYLAGAGVGIITIVDPDEVEAHNLHRQVLFAQKHIGKKKAKVASKKLNDINDECQVITVTHVPEDEDLEQLFYAHDLVIDCTDDFEFSLQLNQLAIAQEKPVVFANASQMHGQLFAYSGRIEHACLCCLWGNQAPVADTCDEAGVLGPVPGTMAALQAIEAIKYLIKNQIAVPIHNTLLHYDFLKHEYRKLTIAPDPTCAHHNSLIDNEQAEEAPEEEAKAPTFSGNLDNAIEEGFTIIDICSAGERDEPLAIEHEHISLERLVLGAEDYLEADKEYLFVCKTGKRSRSLHRLLSNKGYKNITAFIPE